MLAVAQMRRVWDFVIRNITVFLSERLGGCTIPFWMQPPLCCRGVSGLPKYRRYRFTMRAFLRLPSFSVALCEMVTNQPSLYWRSVVSKLLAFAWEGGRRV